MKTSPVLQLSALVLLGGLGLSAQAAGPSAADANAAYRQEVARCNSGQSQEDRATCLKEARNAHADALRGRLDNGQQANYEANAVARCDRLPPGDKADCVARMHGQGTVSGSVDGGGIYRELVTEVPAPPQTDNSATSTSGTSAAPADGAGGPVTTPPMEPAR
jgi:hypothetical protein